MAILVGEGPASDASGTLSTQTPVYCVQYMRPRRSTPNRVGWPLSSPAWCATTWRGYRYDLRHFLAWHRSVQEGAFAIEGLVEYERIAYRRYMAAAGRRPATVNRRLDGLRRLCRWGAAVAFSPLIQPGMSGPSAPRVISNPPV